MEALKFQAQSSKERVIMCKKIKIARVLLLALTAWIVVYFVCPRETVVYEKEIDRYAFRAAVTCRPDEMFTYYPYIVIKTSRGLEVARSQITNRGYEYLNACKNSFPVINLSMADQKKQVRLQFDGRANAFGDAEYIDVSVSYFSPR